MSLTGEFYGEGGVEKDVYHGNPLKSGVSGGVIMSKLGNETAKCVISGLITCLYLANRSAP